MVSPVSVNSASTLGVEATTSSGSAIGDQSFYFGGNPNTAAALNNKWLIAGAVVVAIVIAFIVFRRGRP